MIPAGHLPILLSMSALLLTGSLALSPPKFTKVPKDIISTSGGVASFVCQATGDPKPRVTWNKNGKSMSSQRIEKIEFDGGAGVVLRILPLRAPQDEDIYGCVAENSEGKVSVQAKLSIISEDLLPAGFPKIEKNPQLKVVSRTTSNGRIKQLRSGALQIDNAEDSDEGKYECMASNVEGVRHSSYSRLYVRDPRVYPEERIIPPHFSIIPPATQEIVPGSSANLTCVAAGSPMPCVKWMLNSEDLTPEDDYLDGSSILKLKDILESANYTCVVKSILGIIKANTQIIVKSLPKPPTFLVLIETTATSITIAWDNGSLEPVSHYIIEYSAKSPESKFKAMDPITTTRYSIRGLSPNTDYEIRVSAFNAIGQGPPSDPVEATTLKQAN
ncbi:hypothetical protein QQF64_025852 [Cirrhinus molitorella]|uniref:Uncharacterized protein n=1 Tax=Cirrhinus molitorella TaxID=172907 RepID=A0ABR3NQ77_9TELE